MQMEKRVYQLELVNREKNYNQVFNARPQVGVLNPLAGKVGCASPSNGYGFTAFAILLTSAEAQVAQTGQSDRTALPQHPFPYGSLHHL